MFLILIYFTFYFILLLFNDYPQTAHNTVSQDPIFLSFILLFISFLSFFHFIIYTLYISFAEQLRPRNQLGRINFRTGYIVWKCLLFAIGLRTFVTAWIRGPIKRNRFGTRTIVNSRNVRFSISRWTHLHVGCEVSHPVVAKWWQRLHPLSLSSRDNFSQSIVYHFLKVMKIISKFINKYITFTIKL